MLAFGRALRWIIDFWLGLQVELHGHYSIARMRTLKHYEKSTSTGRAFLVTMLSPIPCLLLITLMDCCPLAPPEEGNAANYAFWVRQYLSVGLISLGILEQLRLTVFELQISTSWLLTTSVLAAAGGAGSQFVAAYIIGFPVPFSLLVGTPLWFTVIIVRFVCSRSVNFRGSSSVRRELWNYLVVVGCQAVITFIYPAYLYGFIALDSTAQTVYVLLLPVIKIITKNWISFFMGQKDDLKPQVVIFNIEVFNALYVASSMQNSTSISTTMALFLVDIILVWVSINDVKNMLNGITVLLEKIPADHPLQTADFVDVAFQIIGEDERVRTHESLHSWSMQRKQTMYPTTKDLNPIAEQRSPGKTDLKDGWAMNRVVPVSPVSLPPPSQLLSQSSRADNLVKPFSIACSATTEAQRFVTKSSLSTIFSANERLKFVQSAAQVLFATEFVILIEYTEVIIPFIYSVYTAAMFHLPNRVYYPQLRDLNEETLAATLGHVSIYGIMELLSLVLMSMLLKWKLGISTLRQLAFVLDFEWRMVQANLFLWIPYTIQNSLKHGGADFSWSFDWLNGENMPGSGSSVGG